MPVTPRLQIFCCIGVHERTIMSVLGWSTTAMASRYTDRDRRARLTA
jgi:hypothetical protein